MYMYCMSCIGVYYVPCSCFTLPYQVSTFNELVDLTGETGEEDSYKALTALGILVALQSLVKATFNETRV